MPYKDPQRRREYGRIWMRRNPEKAREAMRRWRVAHPDEHRRARNAWDQANPERTAARKRRYWLAHPEVRQTKSRNRRAREVNAGGRFSTAEWLALVEQYGGRCAYCGEAGVMQPEHKIPLARGGTNAIENILPACGRCNRKKHLMTESEFRARLEQERRNT
jgi:5-methylcytosine-specific restriction endonuclease McrA